jgi:cell division protease FtsH
MGNRTISEATQQQVDAEIRRILDEQYTVAREILENNQSIAHEMVKALMQWETIDREQIVDIMAGREPQPPKVYVPENPITVGDETVGEEDDQSSTPPPLPSLPKA